MRRLIEKVYIALKRLLVEMWMFKEVLVKTQKEEICRESSYHLREYIIMNRMLLEIWMIKILMVKSQAEMRNTLLETVGKPILIIK